MTNDPTGDFFAALIDGSHVPRLSRCAGTVRFEVMHPDGRVDMWRVEIAKGDVNVSKDDAAADAVVRGDKAVLDGVFSGEVNPVAATLRGVLVVDGNWDLVLMCQRLFGEEVFAAERAEIEESSPA